MTPDEKQGAPALFYASDIPDIIKIAARFGTEEEALQAFSRCLEKGTLKMIVD